MPEIIIIADDLSGAADSGVAFTHQGYQAMVMWRESQSSTADVMVLSTESRHIAQVHAADKVRAIGKRLSKLSTASFFYKKIDSTLRGHPAAELFALMDGLGIREYRIHRPQPPASENVNYGIWLEFRKAQRDMPKMTRETGNEQGKKE